MLDGKCIDELMKPGAAPDLDLTEMEASTQSQASAQIVVPGEALPLDGKSLSRFAKARGKARAVEPPSQSSQPAKVNSDRTASTENNSMRSRLRPRNNHTGHVGHMFSSLPTLSYTRA